MEKPVLPIDDWLTLVRSRVEARCPDLLPLLDVYEDEARFGRQYLDLDLGALPEGAAVLEVGAGAFLLSCQLRREGFYVTALEPVGDGFSCLARLREIVVDAAKERGWVPEMIGLPVEQLPTEDLFDYAFSINVMEHVDNVSLAIERITRSLRLGSSYRFTCPNYLFPYEPHFDIPILASKRWTERAFTRRIAEGNGLDDPQGVWRSLNWITVPAIRGAASKLRDLDVRFNRAFLETVLERVVTDAGFATRRSGFIRRFVRALVALRIHRLATLFPPELHPTIDCVLTRRGRSWPR